MVAKHPGFKKSAQSIAKKQGIPVEQANKYLAKGARNASPAAKKANPRLKRVKMPKKKKKKVSRA